MAARHLKSALDRLRGAAPVQVDATLALRAMRSSDVVQVIAIERRAYDYPWSAGIFRDCLRAGYTCRVLQRGGRILGYGIMTAAAEEAHILNVCVDPGHQGQGLGGVLVRHMLTLAGRMKAHAAYLEVRPSNRAARALYARLGFEQVGLRKDYYPDGESREDALILLRELC
jgi:[ribosomal protein S18]-alanine N-acetyltransferase